ncbi:alpha/beta fold hydrolase [Neptunicoccus sediminis]|uniref:alpha/beta fold hydrolase n=1 Tax=Neptunicoccus sediminis TaxID=1892596 RepID=UPI0008461596|nr:alpha/beta hydrolase [Neptunicoccus sediminis]
MGAHDTDFIEAGRGEKVILIHSSVAGARQWRSLMAALADEFHVIAINLFGYGKTRAWGADSGAQRLEDQARLIEPFLPEKGEQFSLVGHSFGGSVAMKAAALFREQVNRLVLIEPNPFYLLDKHGRAAAYQEAVTLRDLIKAHGKAGSWEIAAEKFADYWTGAGSWNAMPDDRKEKFSQALKPNFHEWDAVMKEETSLREWERDLPAQTTVLTAADTVNSIDEIYELLRQNISGWNFEQIDKGGHMAVLSSPEQVNPRIIAALR